MSHREKHSPVKIGDILKSQYEVTTQLGKGGFGAVFEVVDKNTKSTFALKVSQFHLCIILFLLKLLLFADRNAKTEKR